ncbi:preprotein translocase subunit TatB [Legionella sp. MW5194]|uniref:Sec-independent protein translocase subunit TatA/TatB n=1 Tax=Legionella sp. MW5194 TaxID=2662448 RepID=UPI00193CF7AF|nr:twin-arginine translocase TatA/TatE family subunit [Legionella sp. MW5194]QRN02456.1 preprotein translocase subunit TatB [Legionella sp. MW5194]
MTSGELLLTLIIALLVFGPNKLPMLAMHLGKLFRFLNRFKIQLNDFWQEQLKEQQLRENTKKAEQADALYQQEEKKQ